MLQKYVVLSVLKKRNLFHLKIEFVNQVTVVDGDTGTFTTSPVVRRSFHTGCMLIRPM